MRNDSITLYLRFIAAVSAVALAHCSSGSGLVIDAGPDGAVDVPMDTADAGDTPYDPPPVDYAADPFTDPAADDPAADTGGDEGSAATGKMCVISCSLPSECCTSASCGTYPDRWSCDAGYCMGGGCGSDPECVVWASGLGLPDASSYKCRGWAGGFSYCFAGCAGPTDCCNPEYIDCDTYPARYLCDEGGCLMDICRNDTECQSFAAAASMYRPDLYRCRSMAGSEYYYCAQSCSGAAECCADGSCTAWPQHYTCTGGFCTATCDSDTECRQYAVVNNLPHAERCICREFTF